MPPRAVEPTVGAEEKAALIRMFPDRSSHFISPFDKILLRFRAIEPFMPRVDSENAPNGTLGPTPEIRASYGGIKAKVEYSEIVEFVLYARKPEDVKHSELKKFSIFA